MASLFQAEPPAAAAELRLREEVRDVVLACTDPPLRGRLQALVLTGSLARGEGSWLHGGDSERLLGDADLLLVLRAGEPLPAARQLARLERQAVGALARGGVQAEVTLRAVHPRYFETLPPHLFGYELRQSGAVLWGAGEVLQRIPAMEGARLPREDAFRLLANRILELLPSACALRGARPATPEQIYPWVKLYLDMGTSYLMFRGTCAPSYAERAERLRRQTEAGRAGAWATPAFARQVAACTAWKLRPQEDGGGLELRPAQAIAQAESLWRWELAAMGAAGAGVARHFLLGSLPVVAWRARFDSRQGTPAGAQGVSKLPPDERRAQLWRAWLRGHTRRARLRGWGSAVRHVGWSSRRQWPRWAWMARRAAPRYWIYEAGAELFFRLPGLAAADWPARELAAIASRLPLPPPEARRPEPEAVLRQLALNYQRLAASTRA